MNIVFIDPTSYIINYGLRVLAAHVASLGHTVTIIFVPPSDLSERRTGYPEALHEALAKLVHGADLVGFSFVSNYVALAQDLSDRIRALGIPVAWGGIHAMTKPEECLEHADMVCLGEGEEAMTGLLERMADGQDITDAPNFMFKRDGRIIRNEVLPLVTDLDRYPFPLLDLGHLFIREDDTIVPLSEERYKSMVPAGAAYNGLPEGTYYQYMTMASRGCPHACAYCCNRVFKELYQGKGPLLRLRSPENVIRELEAAREGYPFFNFINIFDDDFLARPLEDIKVFAQLYRERINMPFKCNCSPTSVSEAKIQALVDAGLVSLEMGLQTASPRVNREVYMRKVSNQSFMDAANIICRFPRIIPYYDVILDNPFESAQDTLETIRFIGRIPVPFRLSWFSLTFYPGTELHRRALEQGFLHDEIVEVYEKKNNAFNPERDPYLKYLITIAPGTSQRGWLPRFLFFNVFATLFAVRVFNNRLLHGVPRGLYALLKRCLGKG